METYPAGPIRIAQGQADCPVRRELRHSGGGDVSLQRFDELIHCFQEVFGQVRF